ncbi:hypothetical protein OH492_11730 [Vibrio chagasii]|nr:hypothetical protein [Vibrio chagasii]
MSRTNLALSYKGDHDYFRTAFFEAIDLTEEQKQDFYQYMENEVAPIIRTPE